MSVCYENHQYTKFRFFQAVVVLVLLYGCTTFFANISQAESLLHSLEQAARVIGGLYVKSDKTEFMCFNQDGAISSVNRKPLKLVN